LKLFELMLFFFELVTDFFEFGVEGFDLLVQTRDYCVSILELVVELSKVAFQLLLLSSQVVSVLVGIFTLGLNCLVFFRYFCISFVNVVDFRDIFLELSLEVYKIRLSLLLDFFYGAEF